MCTRLLPGAGTTSYGLSRRSPRSRIDSSRCRAPPAPADLLRRHRRRTAPDPGAGTDHGQAVWLEVWGRRQSGDGLEGARSDGDHADIKRVRAARRVPSARRPPANRLDIRSSDRRRAMATTKTSHLDGDVEVGRLCRLRGRGSLRSQLDHWAMCAHSAAERLAGRDFVTRSGSDGCGMPASPSPDRRRDGACSEIPD